MKNIKSTTDLESVAAQKYASGQLVKKEGIFLCQYSPRDEDGKNLGKIFNVFVSQEDLTDKRGAKETYTYINGVKRVASLKKWHGHDGMLCETEEEFHHALRTESHHGRWMIAPLELLAGKESPEAETMQQDNLFACRNEGSFKNTFSKAAAHGEGSGRRYMTCTKQKQGKREGEIFHITFPDRDLPGLMPGGDIDTFPKDDFRISVRPMRFVLA